MSEGDLSSLKINATGSTHANSTRMSLRNHKLISNVFLSPITLKCSTDVPYHKELVAAFKAHLKRTKGIELEKQYTLGRSDMTTPTQVIEFKRLPLMRQISDAMGQLDKYHACDPDKQQVMVIPIYNRGIFALRFYTPEFLKILYTLNERNIKIQPVVIESNLGEESYEGGYMSAILASVETGIPLLSIYDALLQGKLKVAKNRLKKAEPKVNFAQLKNLFSIGDKSSK